MSLIVFLGTSTMSPGADAGPGKADVINGGGPSPTPLPLLTVMSVCLPGR